MSASEEQGQGPVIRDRRRIDPVTGQPRHPAQPADGVKSAGAKSASGQAEDSPPGGDQQAPAGRAAGQSRPGKHAVSKPGLRAEAGGTGAVAGAEAGGTGAAAGAEPAGTDQQRPQAEAGVSGEAAQDRPAEPDLSVALAERTADLQRVQAEYSNYRKRVERDRAAVREHALSSVLAELLPVLDDIGRAREHGELVGGFKSVAESLEATTVKLGLASFGEAGETFDPNVHEALTLTYSADVTEPTCAAILQPGYRVGERVLRPARVVVAEPTDPAGARPDVPAPDSGDDASAPQADEAAAAGQADADADGSEHERAADPAPPPD